MKPFWIRSLVRVRRVSHRQSARIRPFPTARSRPDNIAPPIRNLQPTPTSVLLAVAVLTPLLLAYLSCFKRSLIDDAFITLQYASTLSHHWQWGFFPGAVTNTATSPLNVVLTALVGTMAPDMVTAAIWLATAEMLALAMLLGVLSQRVFGTPYFGALAFLATIANPLFMSTIGLESLLYVTLMAAALCLLLLRRWSALALCLALLTLTRPDGVLLFVAVLVFASPRSDETQPTTRAMAHQAITSGSWWRGRLRLVVVYVLCLLPWHLFAWIHLGSLLPDTFFLKVGNPWGSLTFARGPWVYLSRYPWPTLLSLVLVPFIPLWFLRGDRERSQVSLLIRVLGVYAVAYYAGYALLGPGPYHWYYAPLVSAGVWMGALALAAEYHRTAHRSGLWRAAVLTTPALAILGMAAHFLGAGAFPPTEAPIHTNWATHDQYQEIGLWLRDHTEATANIRLQGEVGTLAFYSQRRLIDRFSCRSELEPLLRRSLTPVGMAGTLMRLNFFWLGRQQPCGVSDAHLIGSSRPMDTAASPGLVRSWRTSTKWIADGTVLLVTSG